MAADLAMVRDASFRTTDASSLVSSSLKGTRCPHAGRRLQVATAWMEYLFCTPEELEPILEPTRWELTGAHPAESIDPDGARRPPFAVSP